MQGKNQPAFPWCGDLNECPTINLGMSLRDYFAAKAMQGICSNRSHSDLKGHALVSAKVAYTLADAMLKARQEPQE